MSFIKNNYKSILGIILFILLIPYIDIIINSIFSLGRVVGSIARCG